MSAKKINYLCFSGACPSNISKSVSCVHLKGILHIWLNSMWRKRIPSNGLIPYKVLMPYNILGTLWWGGLGPRLLHRWCWCGKKETSISSLLLMELFGTELHMFMCSPGLVNNTKVSHTLLPSSIHHISHAPAKLVCFTIFFSPLPFPSVPEL